MKLLSAYSGTAALFYPAFGFIFAIPFVLYWSGRIDSAAKSGSWGFRLAILPGAVALWPLMALKTIRAFRQRYLPPDPEQPVSPVMQRRIHGVTFVFLAGLLPVICTAALLSRPREHFSTATQLQTAPLPDVVAFAASLPQSLPIRATLRTDGERDQAQLDVSRALDESVVALYWSPGAETGGVAKDAIFLGSLLHIILAIGPLARLDRRFLPLLYNRRHLGVTMFLLALVPVAFALIQFHGGNLNPLVSVLTSYQRDYLPVLLNPIRIAHFPV